MTELNIAGAYAYYAEHIYREERFNLLKAWNLSISGSVPSVDWELFGALLTNERRQTTYGVDLGRFEVKSAVDGNSFEYQYHLNTGLQKLDEESLVDHIFISYSPNYTNITVRLVLGQSLKAIFVSWRLGLEANYSGPNRKLRYRKSITFKTVCDLGHIMMMIRDAKLII